jgi:HKD family nuclease
LRFVEKNIGDLILQKLRSAREARIAVAFFCPDKPTLRRLSRIPNLSLIISEEFTINDPYKLESLKRARIRSILPDCDDGKLHAKVLIFKDKDGSSLTILGSANLTYPGMFSNQEACLVLDSEDSADVSTSGEISRWFDALLKTAQSPDLAAAKKIFDARAQYRLSRRRKPEIDNEAETEAEEEGDTGSYWALKATSGSTGKLHWPMFLAEDVISIGWAELPGDPSQMTDIQLRTAIKKTFDCEPTIVGKTLNAIRQFENMPTGSVVVVCRGYIRGQKKPVHIHGFARVTGDFYAERYKKGEWRFRRAAYIQPIDESVPRSIVANAIRKQSLRQTIHALSKSEFDRLVGVLRQLGVHVEV